MKLLPILLATLLFSVGTFGQQPQLFTIDNFSIDYYGKVSIKDTSEVFSPGWVAIYDRKTNKELIRVAAEELALSLHQGKVMANVKSLPYGEQSLIMHEDFNFDGKKDFALEDGQNSCYHGPSFKIYMATDHGFLFSEGFTRLAQEYCGMFQVDEKGKKLSTMTKSGCCWHEYSEFIVENNKPKALKIITEEESSPFSISTEEIWDGKAMVKKSKRTIDLESVDVILSFTVPENGKQVILYNLNDRTLNYAFLKKDGLVEFYFPAETVYQNPDFKFDKAPVSRSVTFSNKTATYKVYDRPNALGIDVVVGGKTYHLIGDIKTKKGGLENLLAVQLDNVVTR